MIDAVEKVNDGSKVESLRKVQEFIGRLMPEQAKEMAKLLKSEQVENLEQPCSTVSIKDKSPEVAPALGELLKLADTMTLRELYSELDAKAGK